MKLHNYFRSSASFRVRIALALKGPAYDYVPVHLVKGEHKQEQYAAVSATGLVPTLELDDGGSCRSRWPSSNTWTRRIPSRRCCPPTPLGRAQVRALAQLIACEIHPLNNLRVLKYLVRDLKVEEEAKNTWYRHWVRDGLEKYEQELQRLPAGRYSYGDTPTLADCCLVPQIFNGQRFNVDFSGLPRTMAAFEACMQHPAFQQAQPSACPDNEA
jgi:maleylacetoacetate isomerase